LSMEAAVLSRSLDWFQSSQIKSTKKNT
jgi:hypothetical protein